MVCIGCFNIQYNKEWSNTASREKDSSNKDPYIHTISMQAVKSEGDSYKTSQNAIIGSDWFTRRNWESSNVVFYLRSFVSSYQLIWAVAALLQYYINITTAICSPGAQNEVKHYITGAPVT